jgi:N-acetyl-1-D-myo-inositol-2-amino-2-deoxy-alpha-D-glucopyranoside deacetylase
VPASPKKALGLLGSAIAGGFVAVAGTVAHQTQVSGAPVGLVIACIVVLAFAIQARIKTGKLGAIFFAAALAATIFWTGLDFHQDKMIPANQLGLIWSYGSIGLAAIVVIWPKLSKSLWSKRI